MSKFHDYIRTEWKEYHPRLVKFAAYMLGRFATRDTIDSLINETVVSALNYQPRTIEKGEIKILVAIMRNRFLMARDPTRIKDMMDDIGNDRKPVYLPDDYAGHATRPTQINYVFVQEILGHIAELTDKQSDVIILAILGYSPDEICKELELEGRTGERRLHMARNSLWRKTGDERPQKNGKTSQFNGVSWRADGKKWKVAIRYPQNGERVRKHIGYFKNEKEAARAYDGAILQYGGRRETLNFPEVAA